MSSDPILPTRRLMLAGPAVIVGATSAPSSTRQDGRRVARNVRDFGAAGDGVTDDTEAFNRATRADAEWSWDMVSSILVPAGRYRVTGSVFLRKGQSLIGEGLSTYIDASGATASVFVMGRRRGSERGVADPGGLPVCLEGFTGLGGAGDRGFVYACVPGFQISNLFLSAVGIGIEVEGADGILSDIAVDQCLTAILIRDSQNLILSNLNIYLPNYGVIFAGNCRDITINSSIFCYTKYVAILLGDGASDINSIVVSNSIFTNNGSYETFQAFLYSRASRSDLLVTGCSFRNPPGYAIEQGAGTDLTLSVQGCVVDGRHSNPVYDQSPAPRGIKTGAGRFVVSHCIFRNLAEGIRVGPGLLSLQVDGGTTEQQVRRPLSIEADSPGAITIRHVTGTVRWGQGDPAHHRLELPWLGSRSRWEITVTGREPGASVFTARFLIVSQAGGVVVRTVWSAGTAPTAAASVSSAVDDRMVYLLLDKRQFGETAPMVEASAHA